MWIYGVLRSVSWQVLKSPRELEWYGSCKREHTYPQCGGNKAKGVRFSPVTQSACRKGCMKFFQHLTSIYIIRLHLLKPHLMKIKDLVHREGRPISTTFISYAFLSYWQTNETAILEQIKQAIEVFTLSWGKWEGRRRIPYVSHMISTSLSRQHLHSQSLSFARASLLSLPVSRLLRSFSCNKSGI